MDSVVTEDRSRADERFDTARITAAVDALAEKHAGREDVFRSALAQLLKAEMIAARATAQAVLLKDRHGRRCAERLCFMQDEIIRILYSAATRHLYRSHVPSGAERMAVVATGGYGRGLMAPESDIDLLFILPYKQTAWGEQVAEAILLPVGHGPEGRTRHALGRRMHPPGARRYDDPHRDPGDAISDRRPAAL
jgi:[protein-PII] uridylyltransferase